MSSDGLILFEEGNYEELVEGFLKKYSKEWEDYVFDEYANSGPPYEDDRDITEEEIAKEKREHEKHDAEQGGMPNNEVNGRTM